MNKLKALWPHLAVLLVLYICCSHFYGDIIGKLPFGTHDWAQGDRLSLAINFYDRGMDFFHPATHNLSSDNGIVGVEFPIQAYLAAAVAHLTGRDSISMVFRLLDILIAVTGLYFLFRAVYNRSRNFILGLFAAVFIFCSPVYIFYAGNFLPDPAAASVAFIAIYFLLEHIRTKQSGKLHAAIVLAALATLIKASAASCLAAIVIYGLYDTAIRLKQRRQMLLVLGNALICGLVILANIRYIQYLNEKYHATLFLSHTRPFENWEEFSYFIENYFKNWMVHEYFLYAQYPILFFLLAIGARAIIKDKSLRIYSWPLPVFAVCVIVIFWLFSKQYEVHDYYFIATFLPFVAYCLCVSLIAIGERLKDMPEALKMMRLGLLSALVMIFFFADYQASLRMHMDMAYSMDYSFRWMEGGAGVMNDLHVPKNEHIVVAGELTPNLCLVYFDRGGYNLASDLGPDGKSIRRFMNEHAVRTTVMKEDYYHSIHNKDSMELANDFNLLGIRYGKAVLQLR